MTLIQTAKLNGVETMAWLADVLARLVAGQAIIHELRNLLPWNSQPGRVAGQKERWYVLSSPDPSGQNSQMEVQEPPTLV